MVLLKEPLYVFSIPPSIVESLSARETPRLIQLDTPAAPAQPEPLRDAQTGSMACALCLGAVFADVNEQRNHFRSDWHRYNVKMRIQDPNGLSLTETQFAGLVEGLEESLSGSASSSSSDDASEAEDAVSALLHKHKHTRAQSSSSLDERTIPRSPIAWLHSPDVQATQFGVYNTLFPASTPLESYPDALRKMQDGGAHGRTWALFMTAGGHFAGMIVRVAKPGRFRVQNADASFNKKGKGKSLHHQPEFEILAHKTFHRYTTRRKQGGSQSVNDNAKGPAKSAGAQLRRYGEQALRDDIRGLLAQWVEELDACERIFIRASVSNRRIFLESEDAIIQKGDARLRTFPFPTRRPTLAELTRCLTELTRVKISHLTEEALRAADEAYLASLKPKQKPKPPPPPIPAAPREKEEKLSPQEEASRDKWRRLIDMVHKGRLETLQTFWASLLSNPSSIDEGILDDANGSSANKLATAVDTPIPNWLREEQKNYAATLLQVAAAAGQEDVVRWLLVDMHADPTTGVPSTVAPRAPAEDGSEAEDAAEDNQAGSILTSRKAYDLASTRGTRNVFRRTAYAYPDWWDWLGKGEGGARVPSVLSPEMEEADQRKKGARRKGLKERMKEREEEAAKARAKAEAEAQAEKERLAAAAKATSLKKTGPQRLGGATSSTPSAAVINPGVGAMSPEMRAKIERERRARAAEARLRG